MEEFQIREAKASEADKIARLIMLALHDSGVLNFAGSEERIPLVRELFANLAAREDTQYSYRNTLVAVDKEENVAGCVIAYDGADLYRLREAFFAEAERLLGKRYTADEVTDETTPDEIYLDTVAVFPEYRGHNLGAKLVTAMCQRHSNDGKPLGLLCEPGYDHLLRIYGSCGFRRVGSRDFFGLDMHHLVR